MPSGTPGFTVAARLLQGRLVRLGHPRADLRRLPGAGGEPARRARPRASPSSCGSSTRAGSRSPRWPSAWPRAASTSRCRYAKQRQAFGQPIGDYQAIQFKIADMEMRAHTARLAYYDAAARMLAGEQFKRQAAIAKLYASDDRGGQRPRGHPDPRRVRLHERVPGGPVLARRQDPGDRRGHLRGPAHDHRPRSRYVTYRCGARPRGGRARVPAGRCRISAAGRRQDDDPLPSVRGAPYSSCP